MKLDCKDIMLVVLVCIMLILPNIKSIENFSIFDHKLYYPDVDCLYTKENSCIIKPNNVTFFDFNNNCCNNKQKFNSDKYYEKVNSTCVDCINQKCVQHKNNIENFEGRAYYDRKENIFWKTDSPGIRKDIKKCPTFHIKNKSNKCQKVIY